MSRRVWPWPSARSGRGTDAARDATLARRPQKLGLVDRVPDQAPLLGLFTVEHQAEEHHGGGELAAAELTQHPGVAAAGNAGRGRGNGCRKRAVRAASRRSQASAKLTPATHRGAVDRGDRRQARAGDHQEVPRRSRADPRAPPLRGGSSRRRHTKAGGGAPVTITAPTSSCASSSAKAVTISPTIGRVIAVAAGGGRRGSGRRSGRRPRGESSPSWHRHRPGVEIEGKGVHHVAEGVLARRLRGAVEGDLDRETVPLGGDRAARRRITKAARCRVGSPRRRPSGRRSDPGGWRAVPPPLTVNDSEPSSTPSSTSSKSSDASATSSSPRNLHGGRRRRVEVLLRRAGGIEKAHLQNGALPRAEIELQGPVAGVRGRKCRAAGSAPPGRRGSAAPPPGW